MHKIIIGVFAHPDDEAFGPAGTLLQATQAGAQLHLLLLTAGQAGANPDDASDLGAIRLKEWQQAGELLGATSMQHLGYSDGQLCNSSMIEIGHSLIDKARTIAESVPGAAEIEFMSLDLNGYTGHIDHIIAARAACYAFYELKKTDPRFTQVRLACYPQTLLPSVNTDWIYAEAGRTPEEIGDIVDARALRDQIIAIMGCHHSQRADYDYTLRMQGEELGLNYFVVKH